MGRLVKEYRAWERFTREQVLHAKNDMAREGLEASALQMRNEAERLEQQRLPDLLKRVNWLFKHAALGP